MDEVKEEKTTSVHDLAKKFKASEKVMRDEFEPKYKLAKARLRAEHSVKSRGAAKLTHEQVNLVYSIGTNFVNSVYFKAPNVNLTARKEVEHERVEATELKVNDWLKDNKVKKVVKRTVWDAYNGGFGAVFIDYEYDDANDETKPLMGVQLDELGNEIQVPEVDEQGQPLFERIVLKNEITIQRIRPDHIRFPRGFDFDNYQESPWIGFDLIMPLDEVKNNQDWDQEVRESIEGSSYEKLSGDKKTGGKDDDEKYAKISYCFKRPDYPEIQPFELCIFSSEKCDKPLKVMEYKKGHRGYPIHFVYFNPLDDDCPYPCGDPWIFESQLCAVDEWWKKVVQHVKRSSPKIVYDSGSVTPQEAQKLKSNNDNETVGLSNKSQRDLRALITELNSTQVNPDLHRLWEAARELLDQIAPRASVSQGASNADTATEAKIQHVGEMVDVEARIDDVAEFIKEIVLDVAGILENIAAPMAVPSESGVTEIGSDGFTGAVEIDVDVESMQAQNKDVIRRQLIDALGLFTKLEPLMNRPSVDENGQMTPPKMIYVPFWIEKLMDTMNIRNIEKGFTDAPMPPPIVDPNAGMQAPPDELPPIETVDGSMPPEAIEAGLAARV